MTDAVVAHRSATFGELSRKIQSDRFRETLFVQCWKAAQDELTDLHADHATHPATSDSAMGCSNLTYSRRAACNRCGMPSGCPASAARKAASSAMERMLPPETLSRANFRTSSPSAGVSEGKMRPQIAPR